MNDCPVAHPFVSEFHAVVELVGGELCVRDLDSRNGVQGPNLDRLPARQPMPLSSMRNAFVLGRIVDVSVEPFEQNAELGGRPSGVRGSILGNGAALAMPPGLGASSGLAPLPALSLRDGGGRSIAASPPLGPPAGKVPPYSSSPPDLNYGRSIIGGGGQSLPGLPPLPGNFGPYGLPPDQRSAAPGRATPAPEGASRNTQHLTMSTELLALLGLRELGSSLVPGVPLETTGDVARLLTKLHDLVEVFCRCFVALREGSAPFIPAGQGVRAGSRRQNQSASARNVGAARDPASLALALLDWRNQEFDAPKAAEDMLIDIVTHHAALTDAVMRGVESLLEELSPESIETAVKEGPGVNSVFGRSRALWQAYKERYESVANGTQPIERVFGPEFAATYREHVRGRRTQ